MNLGHELLVERVEEAERLLIREFFEEPSPRKRWSPEKHYWTTGVGSSEAHARFLAYLIRSAGGSAGFLSFAELISGPPARGGDVYFLLFSQGLSSNATLVLNAIDRPGQTTLFTAESVRGLMESGKEGRARRLAAWIEKGMLVEAFPIAKEYTVLLRVIGPLCGYGTALRWLFPPAHSLLPCFPSRKEMETAFAKIQHFSIREEFSLWVDEWIAGADCLVLDSLIDYPQNLAYKRMEGIFRDATVFRDAFQFAHGPFQIALGSRKAQWVLGKQGDGRAELAERIQALCTENGIICRQFEPVLHEPYAIFEYEALFNRLLIQALERVKPDQIDWPGKGRDGLLYDWES